MGEKRGKTLKFRVENGDKFTIEENLVIEPSTVGGRLPYKAGTLLNKKSLNVFVLLWKI